MSILTAPLEMDIEPHEWARFPEAVVYFTFGGYRAPADLTNPVHDIVKGLSL